VTALTKAYLAEMNSAPNPAEVPGTKVDVQFNPTSLRVQISNRTAGGQQAGAQARQRPGTGEMQVSFDLVFDTADEGTTRNGVSVLQKTKSVERFVRPRGARPGEEAPPRVVFVWGDFRVQGTMESANIDLDLFDATGIPLRAKVSVSIKGQDPRWTYTPAPSTPANGAGRAPPDAAVPRPGAGTALPPGTPGTAGSGRSPDRILQAMPGESLAQVAARAGLDPSAWRALADGITDPLELALGEEVQLPPSTGSSATGVRSEGRDPERTTAGLPLLDTSRAAPVNRATSTNTSAGVGGADPVRQGQAVAARGGLHGAIAEASGAAHRQAAATSLAAFGVASDGAADATDRPWGMGVPLRPRFGGRQRLASGAAAGRRAASASVASVAPSRSARSEAGCGGGCGCRGCRQQRRG
jgi:hypothetical protein